MVRLWTIAVAAEAWHVTPQQIARELDRDPEQLALVCIPLLRYAEAKRALDGAKNDKDPMLKAWEGSPLMESVKRNWAALATERKRRAAAARGATKGKRG